ncbi:AadA family aminoglycoside 3''-O-nucleotidyltransferase [Bordetella sp. BOR01]|uniref:AadA family aminoglycoside 3''-O-nucleotidyltransferase n=1 Tax=Bordetella sp. BOR01 TaxID=2854779 RepID=UPI001C43ED91|nr:AadA family aminoglycoside 3''-O-nucleotidyltransferase [Bordetella sp. BOR01]MBV7481483.1 AadA family aminoglycoside 3''-O-nucleotidyltransferase [Bordetella sp. BOR01]
MPASIPAEIAQQLSQARAVLERHLAGTLQAIHLFGSAVDGGLKPCSDIDLLVTVGTAPAEPVRRALMLDLLAVSAWPGTHPSCRALEVTVLARAAVVPWRYPARRELQFGEWLRDDLRAGAFEPAMPDHDLAILLTKVRQHSISLLGPPAAEWFDPVPKADFEHALADTVAQWNQPADWEGDERNVVLALARIWYSATTGEIAAKDVAADWALQRLPPAHQAVLARARAGYLGQGGDDAAVRAADIGPLVHYVKAAVAGTGPA